MGGKKHSDSIESISGREASILALLAQSPNLSASDKQRILNSLDGRALKIARALVGETVCPAKSIKDAANGFSMWAQKIEEYMSAQHTEMRVVCETTKNSLQQQVEDIARELTSWDWGSLLIDHPDAKEVIDDIHRLDVALIRLKEENDRLLKESETNRGENVMDEKNTKSGDIMKELLAEMIGWGKKQREHYQFHGGILTAIDHMEPQVLRWVKAMKTLIVEYDNILQKQSEEKLEPEKREEDFKKTFDQPSEWLTWEWNSYRLTCPRYGSPIFTLYKGGKQVARRVTQNNLSSSDKERELSAVDWAHLIIGTASLSENSKRLLKKSG